MKLGLLSGICAVLTTTKAQLIQKGNCKITDATATAARDGLNYAAVQSNLATSISPKVEDNISLVLDGIKLVNSTHCDYSVAPDRPLG